jgi:hypothetical protein
VKFRPGSPSTLGEKVALGLVLRFGIVNCTKDNLDCFEDGFSDNGSILDVGGHRFYGAITKPFLEEVTDMSTLSVTQAQAVAKAATLAPWSKCWP